VGFEFGKKHHITICGKQYPCDIGDCRMLEGVAKTFPKILQAAQELMNTDQLLKAAVKESAPTRDLSAEILARNNTLVAQCREFIEGTLGVDEYQEIFGQRPPNTTEHIDLCAYIYSDIMSGRKELVDEYLDPQAKEEAMSSNESTDPIPTATADDSRPHSGDGLAMVDAPCGLRARLLAFMGGKG
jgi:hypothetical protein